MSPSWYRPEAGIGLSVYMSPHWVEWAGAGMVSPRAGVWPMWQDRTMSWLMKLGVTLAHIRRDVSYWLVLENLGADGE